MRRVTIAAVSAVMLLGGCQTPNPTVQTGPGAAPAAYRASDVDIQRAQALHQEAIQSGKVMAPGENPVANRYLDRVVARIAAQRPPGAVPLRAFIVKEESVNAFTTGTGYLYFNEGLLEALDNEAQLAMVVGHEVAHIDLGHLERRSDSRQTVSVLTQVGAEVLGQTLGGGLAQIGQLGVALAGQRATAYSSQSHEVEADKVGLDYAMRAGYDGLQAASAFRVLSEENGPQSRVAEFFSTHPNSAGRQAQLTEIASATGRPAYVGAAEHQSAVSTLR